MGGHCLGERTGIYDDVCLWLVAGGGVVSLCVRAWVTAWAGGVGIRRCGAGRGGLCALEKEVDSMPHVA